jgi:hypothetical protein
MTVGARLHATLAAVCPILGVDLGPGSPPAVTIRYAANATAQQQADAQTALAAFDWSGSAQTAYDTVQARAPALTTLNSATDPPGKLARATAAVLVDELNDIREWIAAFKVQVAASTTLADLKTRVAALPNMPDRTLAQAKTAIGNKISTGTVDN